MSILYPIFQSFSTESAIEMRVDVVKIDARLMPKRIKTIFRYRISKGAP
jgi:hypothetical protein